jgi:hypothetical protein
VAPPSLPGSRLKLVDAETATGRGGRGRARGWRSAFCLTGTDAIAGGNVGSEADQNTRSLIWLVLGIWPEGSAMAVYWLGTLVAISWLLLVSVLLISSG